MSDQGFNPNRSRVSADTMTKFLNEHLPEELTKVPGIGPAAAKKLAELDEPITNTYMLIGKFLSFKGPDFVEDGVVHTVDCAEHTDRFWYFLKEAGISAHRSAIVKAVAEKVAQAYPAIYDPSVWDDEEEEE